MRDFRLLWLSLRERRVLIALLAAQIAEEARVPGTRPADDLATIKVLLQRLLRQRR